MKCLLAIALALIASFASADPLNPCNAPATAKPYPYADFAAGSGFACVPAPSGVGTVPKLRATAAGAMAFWYCPTATGGWSANWVVGTVSFLSSGTLLSDLYSALASPLPIAALNTLVAKNATLPLNDPSLTPVWCPFADEMVAGTPAPVAVSAVIWRTPAAGTMTLYQATGGKLTAVVSNRKAPTAALCDCASSASSGGSRYCSIRGAAAYELTLCQPSK